MPASGAVSILRSPLLLPLALHLQLLSSCIGSSPIELWVASTGEEPGDRGGGTGWNRDQPLRGLVQAQAAARAALATPEGQHRGVTVTLREGQYFNTSLVLTERDGPGVTWRGEPGAVVYGGARVQGWSPYRGGIWRASLPPSLVDRFGRARFHTLVQGERSGWLARSPNFGSGFLNCSSGTGGTVTCPALPDNFDCVVIGRPGTLNASSACSAFLRAGYSSDIRRVLAANASARSFTVNTVGTDSTSATGPIYLQGALELLDQEGEWAVRGGVLYFWPYSAHGQALDPNRLTITVPVTQRVFSFVGSSHSPGSLVSSITLSGLHIVGASMPASYTYECKGSGPGADGGGGAAGKDCAVHGGPDTPDQTNTVPRSASQAMIYMENATRITIR